jgi:PhnB protein
VKKPGNIFKQAMTMSRINSYLTFNGNCRDAMIFYKKCFGGTLEMQEIGDSPLAKKMPARMKKCILHASLSNDNLILMGTDIVSEARLIRGNSISLMLDCNSEKEIRSYFKKLSASAKIIHPLEKTFFGALLGSLSDKFGNQWLLHFNKKEK